MAVTRRGYVCAACGSSVLCVIIIIVSVSTENWVVSTTYREDLSTDSTVRYGLFRGELAIHIFDTPSYNTLYVTCAADLNACAASCKTEGQARKEEVRALAQGYRPSLACAAVADVDTTNPLERPPVMSFGLYVCVLVIFFLQLTGAIAAGALALLNAVRNPTESVFGLPGCVWVNVVTLVLGLAVMLLFGIYWVTSGLSDHLAVANVAFGTSTPISSLGFSYWILVGVILCSATNVILIRVRQYVLERDPPPPTIKVENHSDGTVFLY